jgi:hypothetical protein
MPFYIFVVFAIIVILRVLDFGRMLYVCVNENLTCIQRFFCGRALIK